MNSLIRTFHSVLWDHLSIVEMGLSDSIPAAKLKAFDRSCEDINKYHQVKTFFYNYGEHQHKYIWGDGISCIWEDNNKRTCYYPWEQKCTAWNSAKFFSFTAIHKIVITSVKNHKRNAGLKIQASVNHVNWDTLYTITVLDAQRMIREPLEIYFSENKQYLYIRIVQEDSTVGYDIESIKIFVHDNPKELLELQNSIFYVLSGAMNINGLRYKAPFGFVKLKDASISVTVSQKKDTEVLWVTFNGNAVTDLLKNANFDLNDPVFEITNRAYLEYLYSFVNENCIEINEENQFDLMSKFMSLLAAHSKYYSVSSAPQSNKEKYIVLVLQYINENRYKNISLSDMAKHCAISEKYLIKIFKEEMGVSPIQYLNNRKIQKAKRLLRDSQKSVEAISEEVGICSPEYFCRLFKKYENCSPMQYKKRKMLEKE